MRNKPNFTKTQMNLTSFLTTNYEQRTMNYEVKNKPNSNPIQTQNKPNFRNGQNERNFLFNKELRTTNNEL